jgi:hypothetical protein
LLSVIKQITNVEESQEKKRTRQSRIQS